MCILLPHFKQGKRFCFSTYHLVNLRRISSASPVNVKYSCLAFVGDALLILSTVNDLFQSEYNSLKRRISSFLSFL